jgi:hypothetical protein
MPAMKEPADPLDQDDGWVTSLPDAEDMATSLGRITYHAGLRHDLRSIMKSIASLIFGIGVDRDGSET